MRPTPARSAAIDSLLDPQLVDRFDTAVNRLGIYPKLGLAVSGGPDSMAMLLLAHEALRGDFEVATVNHGLRAEAADECALVAAACEERGIPCSVLHVEVAEGNLQSRAREARYDALLDWAQKRSLSAVATAHHADDQAETFLMRLNRGSGLNGLASIRSQVWFEGSTTPVIRPLLEFRRAELRGVLEASGQRFASDPSNEDLSFDRVRMREQLADADWIDPVAIAQSASHLADAQVTLASIADDFYLSNVRREDDCIIVPFLGWLDTNARMIVRAAAELGASVSFGEIMDLLSVQLARRQKANVAGILIEQTDFSYRISPEPPRKTG